MFHVKGRNLPKTSGRSQEGEEGEALLGSGRKLRAIRTCIGNLNGDIDDIIRKGLILAEEITDYVSTSSRTPRSKPRGSVVAEEEKAETSSCSTHFPAIERGLRAGGRLLDRHATFHRQNKSTKSEERLPLRDISNRRATRQDEQLEVTSKNKCDENERRRDEAARLLQHYYKAHLRKRVQTAIRIQAHIRSYLSRLKGLERRAVKKCKAGQMHRAQLLLKLWSERTKCRQKVREATQERHRKYGVWAHYYLGKPFDGDLIKPVEGIFVMAKEYHIWRVKALTFLAWMKALSEDVL